MSFEPGLLLRIFVGERDKHGGMPAYEWIVSLARDFSIAGATVIRGMAGYGAHHRIHTAKVLELSLDLPVIIEIVDTEAKIRAFMQAIDPALNAGMATLETIEFRSFGTG